tara:strand:+ start:193 stop:399 length:207 start_codon:yes stop_codon:yes gene_type:complete
MDQKLIYNVSDYINRNGVCMDCYAVLGVKKKSRGGSMRKGVVMSAEANYNELEEKLCKISSGYGYQLC